MWCDFRDLLNGLHSRGPRPNDADTLTVELNTTFFMLGPLRGVVKRTLKNIQALEWGGERFGGKSGTKTEETRTEARARVTINFNSPSKRLLVPMCGDDAGIVLDMRL
jgi:hypothetical protein